MRGQHVPEHFTITGITPDQARCIKTVVDDLRHDVRRRLANFNLNEQEDEALEALSAALEPSPGPDGGVPAGV